MRVKKRICHDGGKCKGLHPTICETHGCAFGLGKVHWLFFFASLVPTQKPIRLMRWCIEQARVPAGGTVLDPYMGSGTTGLACLRTGHKFIGIDIDTRNFDIAVNRLTEARKQMRLNIDFQHQPKPDAKDVEACGK